MTKVLLVVRDSRYFLSHRLPLALALQQSGYTVHVLCAQREEEDFVEIRQHGLSVSAISLLGSQSIFFRLLSCVWILFQVIRRESPDIIFSVTVLANLLTGVYCRVFRIQHIVLIAGLGTLYRTEGIKYRLLRCVSNLFYRLALNKPHTKVIFQNTDDQGIFLRNKLCLEQDSFLIPGSGVDLKAFPYRPYRMESFGPRKVGMVGRLLRDKGVLEFVEAARIVREKRPETEFLLVGGVDTANPTSLNSEEIETLQKSESVRLLGHQSDVAKVLEEIDIFCLPSYHEGLPKAMLEAAAVGCPLVVTDIAGCRAFVDEGESGLLVPVKDAKALARAIESLLDKPEKAAHLSERAFEKLERKFSQDRVLGLYLEMFGELDLSVR